MHKVNQDNLDKIVDIENQLVDLKLRISEYDQIIRYLHECIVRRIDLKNEYRVMINCDWKKVEDMLGGPL